jgi:hypothetical protein
MIQLVWLQWIALHASFLVFGAARLLIQFGALIAPFTHVFLVFGAALLLIQFDALIAPFAHVFFVFGAALLLIQFGALIAPFTHVFLQRPLGWQCYKTTLVAMMSVRPP